MRRSAAELPSLMPQERLIKYPERECKIPGLSSRSQLSGQFRIESSPTNIDSARLFNDSTQLVSPSSQHSSPNTIFAFRGGSTSNLSEQIDPRLQASRRGAMEESGNLSCVVSPPVTNAYQSSSVPNQHAKGSSELKPSQIAKRVDCWLSPEQLEYSKKLKRTSPLEDRIVYNGLREGAARKVKVTLERSGALTSRAPTSSGHVRAATAVEEQDSQHSRCFSASGNYDSNKQRRTRKERDLERFLRDSSSSLS